MSCALLLKMKNVSCRPLQASYYLALAQHLLCNDMRANAHAGVLEGPMAVLHNAWRITVGDAAVTDAQHQYQLVPMDQPDHNIAGQSEAYVLHQVMLQHAELTQLFIQRLSSSALRHQSLPRVLLHVCC